jgi:hypothetical protein
MDKPCHPLVIQPWKIQQSQRAKRKAAPVKTGKERGRLNSKAPQILTSKKTREQDSKKTG